MPYAADDPSLAALFAAGAVAEVHDTLLDQLGELVEARAPRVRLDDAARSDAVSAHLAGADPDRYGRWVWYPWSRRLVHLLPPEEHRELRTDRNRYKIAPDEQRRLGAATIGVVGLSVGQSAALTLALEGIGGCLRLADFDTLGLSNLNRLRAGVHELGVSKCVLAARAIAELDPYLRVEIFPAGVDPGSLPRFLDGLDLLVEECDDLRMKLLLREGARARRIPVLMDTSDRGLLDIERFDREPERPTLHGLVGDLRADDLVGLPTKDKIPHVLRIVGEPTLTARFAATLPEVRETVSTWPQLASGVALGGALVADTARRVLLGQLTTSGRFWIDLDHLVRAETAAHANPVTTSAPTPPLPESRAFDLPPPVVPAARDVATGRALAAAAILAPSGHNAQPWRFRWDGAFSGHLDPARRLTHLDFGDGGAWVALGAAALNAELAARAAGLAPTLAAGPLPDDPLHAFTLTLGAGSPDVDALHPWLGRRITNRRLGARRPLGAAREALLAEAGIEGCPLLLVDDPAALAPLGEAIGIGDRIGWLHAPIHREIVAGLRWSPDEVAATRDGLDVDTLELSAGDRAALRVISRWERAAVLAELGLGRALEDAGRDLVHGSSAVGLLLAPGEGPGAYFRAGRAMQRVWLRAESLGLAMHPVATLPFLFAAHAAGGTRDWPPALRERLLAAETRFRAVLPARPGHVEALLFRLAHAPPATARATRRPVEAVLTLAEPGFAPPRIDVRTVSDPYVRIAEAYDAEFDGASADAAWFARHAAAGPLLVLGCGSGRVTALLGGERAVTGLDRSEAMLERARARGDGVRYVLGDMRSFDLGAFGEIVIPNAAFCFLHSRADQLACLQSCARALAPGGALTLDLPAPDFQLLATPHTPERPAWRGTVRGLPAHRTREVHRRPLAGRVDLLDRYWIDGALVATSLLPLQLVFPREAEWLCEAAGFWVDALYGDYAGGPVQDGCDRILVRAYRC